MYREPVKRFFFLELPPHSLKRLSTRPTTVAVQSQQCAVTRDILGSLTPSSTPARRLAEGCSTAVLCVVTQCSSPQRLAVKQARRLAMCSHLCAVCVEFKAALYQTYYGCCSVTVVCSDSGHFGQSYTKQYPCSTPRRRLLHSRSLCCHAMLLPTKIGSEAGKTPRDVFAFMCCMRGVYPEKTCPGQGQKVTLPPNLLPFWPHMTYDVAQATGLNSPRGNLLLICDNSYLVHC